jgi:hypothetical protein
MKKLAPIAAIDCRTDDEICSVHRDNLSTKHGWVMVNAADGTVTFAEQVAGEGSTGMVTLPRGEVKRMIAFLTKPQARRKSR